MTEGISAEVTGNNCPECAVRENYRKLTKLLIEKGLTITTMESATSGQIASLITDTEGASAVFKGAYVTYCNEAKIMHGVSPDIIQEHGVYSIETAEAMARACREAYRAHIAVGVTGTMGNVDPANSHGSVPGQVYFSIGVYGEFRNYYIELLPRSTRLAYKLAVAKEVCDAIMTRLQELS